LIQIQKELLQLTDDEENIKNSKIEIELEKVEIDSKLKKLWSECKICPLCKEEHNK